MVDCVGLRGERAAADDEYIMRVPRPRAKCAVLTLSFKHVFGVYFTQYKYYFYSYKNIYYVDVSTRRRFLGDGVMGVPRTDWGRAKFVCISVSRSRV